MTQNVKENQWTFENKKEEPRPLNEDFGYSLARLLLTSDCNVKLQRISPRKD
jgi:hypothetical protein